MSFAENLANVVNRYDEISSLLSSPDVTPENLVKMNKELAELGPVVEAVNHYRKAEKDLAPSFNSSRNSWVMRVLFNPRYLA